MTDSVSTTTVALRGPDVILFTAQIFLIVVIAVASIINLSLGIGNQNLWMLLLTSCMGIVMPNPKLKVRGLEDNKSSGGTIRERKNGPRVLHDSVV